MVSQVELYSNCVATTVPLVPGSICVCPRRTNDTNCEAGIICGSVNHCSRRLLAATQYVQVLLPSCADPALQAVQGESRNGTPVPAGQTQEPPSGDGCWLVGQAVHCELMRTWPALHCEQGLAGGSRISPILSSSTITGQCSPLAGQRSLPLSFAPNCRLYKQENENASLGSRSLVVYLLETEAGVTEVALPPCTRTALPDQCWVAGISIRLVPYERVARCTNFAASLSAAALCRRGVNET